MRPSSVVAAALLCGASLAHGQGDRPLTVAEARERARTLGAAAAVAAAREDGAVARTKEARANRWPQVSVSGRYARLSDVPEPGATLPGVGTVTLGESVLNQAAVGAAVSVPLYTGSRLEHAERAAEQLALAARGEREGVERRMATAAETAYWRLYQARRGVRAVEETVRLVEAHGQDVARLQGAGLVTADVVLEADLRLSEARLRLVETRHGMALAEAALARAASLPLETAIALVDTPAVTSGEPPALADLRGLAEAQRPDLAALAAAETAAQRRLDAVKGERLPTVAAEASWDLAHPSARYFPQRSEWHDTWLVGVGVRWSAWDAGARKARRQQAEAEVRQARERQRDARQAVALEVLQRRLAATEATQRVALARQAVAQATERERQVRSRFEAGAALSTEVLDTEVALEGARLALARALADGCVARAELALAIGERQP